MTFASSFPSILICSILPSFVANEIDFIGSFSRNGISRGFNISQLKAIILSLGYSSICLNLTDFALTTLRLSKRTSSPSISTQSKGQIPLSIKYRMLKSTSSSLVSNPKLLTSFLNLGTSFG